MFGWRKRIGYIAPTVIEVVGYEFYRFAPDGIGLTGVTCGIVGHAPAPPLLVPSPASTCPCSMGDRGGKLLIHARWPEPESAVDAEAKAEIEWLIRLISDIRSSRTELNVRPSETMQMIVDSNDQAAHERLKNNYPALKRLARIFATEDEAQSEGSIVITHTDATYYLPLSGLVDVSSERTRLTNAITSITKERDSLAARIGNPAFVEKAKPEAVEKARADHAEKSAEVERLAAALARLG